MVLSADPAANEILLIPRHPRNAAYSIVSTLAGNTSLGSLAFAKAYTPIVFNPFGKSIAVKDVQHEKTP